MEVRRLSLIEGAKNAYGTAVIIDVFRAFTTAAYVMAQEANRIYPVGSVKEAFELKKMHQDWILIGERQGIKVKGFEYGNSPYEISLVNFSGKTVVQTTGAGTQGVVNARLAKEILLGSFVMAGAIAEYIKKTHPEVVSLVSMGDAGIKPNEEDESCAEYIENLIYGKSADYEKIESRIRRAPSGAKFFDPSRPQFRKEDFQLAMELDKFDFILKVVRGKRLYVVKENP